MQSEQQQRIMGYFIEEAKDHLNTIEQGLLSLQNTMEDREMLNEVFRAAHSVKGGAAMLGINSIQQTAHRLEDCFKVLQESPVIVDGQLESLFLRVFDTLQALVEQLQSPYGLSDETANEIMSEAEPIFEELNTHLERLVHQTEHSFVATVPAPKVAAVANSQINTRNPQVVPSVFKRDVLLELREMLQLFKQQDLPEHRTALQEHCRHLARLGESLDFPGWDELLETARLAIAQPTNSYRLLANLVIKEIKQAQELVVTGRSMEIGVSEQLQALAPERTAATSPTHESELLLTFDDNDYGVEPNIRESETGTVDEYNWLQDENGSTYLFDSPAQDAWEDTQEDAHEQDLFSDHTAEITFDDTPTSSPHARSANSRFGDSPSSVVTPGAPPIEPEVGMAELNTLADIFEGQTPDLDQTWQEEEILNFDDEELIGTSGELLDWDDQSDFSDLVSDLDGWSMESDEAAIAESGTSPSSSDDLMDLFGDDFSGTDAIAELGALEFALDAQQPIELPRETHTSELPPFSTNTDDDFADLLFEEESPDPLLASHSSSEDLSSLFGDSFFEEEDSLEPNSEDIQFDADAFLEVPQQEDDLFAMPPADEAFDADAFLEVPQQEDDLFAMPPADEAFDADALLEVPQQEDDLFAMPPADEAFDADALLEVPQQEDDLFAMPPGDDFEAESVEFLNSTDSSVASEESLFEDFTDEETDLLPFEGTSQPWENTEGDVEEWDFDDHVADTQSSSEIEMLGLSESDEFVQSDRDFSDLLEISESDRFVAEALEDLEFEELPMEDTAANLDFDALAWDESSDDFNFADEEDLTGSENAIASDTPTVAPAPTAFEELLGDGSESGLEDFNFAEMDIASEASELDFDLEATSASPLDAQLQSPEDLVDLFGDEALTESEVPQSVDFESFEDFEEFFDTSTAQTDSEAWSEASVPIFEELDDPTAEQPEAPNFENLNAFFDAEETSDQEGEAFSGAPELSVEDLINFEDFSLFETSETQEITELPNFQASDAEDDVFAQQLFESSSTDTEPIADLSFEAFDQDTFEEGLFDFDTPIELQEGDSISPEFELSSSPSDLEALFDETLEETEATTVQTPEPSDVDLSSFALEQLNFDADLFGSDMFSSQELGVDTQEATLPMLAFDEEANSEEMVSSSPESDWEELLGDQTFEDSNFLNFSEENIEEAEQTIVGGQEPAMQPMHASVNTHELISMDDFADLEAMLEAASVTPELSTQEADVFQELDALLEEQPSASTPPDPASVSRPATSTTTMEDAFADLESLLEQAEKTMGGPPTTRTNQNLVRPMIRRGIRAEQNMRVPIKQLDSLSNLVGELVVNRNTLEQDQERLRQFLDNLSHQVLALSDVGSRMQDLYERSLLESSLLASRQSHRASFHLEHRSSQIHQSVSGMEYDPLEMDRFTGFHLLSQEMIELIVRVRESASDIEFLVDETDQVARMLRQITTQLQEGLTRARMVPFAQNADRLLRAVHEISRKLGKEAKLIVEGRETLIDKMILEHLYDPMTHLVNNALTHGIELPEVRKAAGKQAVGQVTLRAFHQGNQTVISISDDGAGINAERVRSKAIEQRLISPAEAKQLTNVELYDFLFHPGFSTKDKADDFAGRGVGMDVVRTSLSEIRGTIHIESGVGKGTSFTIRLPLTLSICKALCCLSDKARIAFPMDGVEDMLDVPRDRVQMNSEGQTCIPWRDTQLSFQPLSELLTYNRQLSRNTVYGGKREDDMISIVVLRSAGNFLAVQVDQVIGEQEIVIKQLEGPPPKPVGIAGATVLGDGRIMPIADVMELIDLSRGAIRKDGGVAIWQREETPIELPPEVPEAKTEPMVLIVDDSITVRELLSMTFSKAGYRVEQARDGQEAWEKLRSGLPCDIVFCDIEMPRMDGLELLSRLQKDESLCHLPIAMLTSRGADRHRQMASQLGASGYFTKPYLEEVLLDAAQRMIKGEVLFSTSNA